MARFLILAIAAGFLGSADTALAQTALGKTIKASYTTVSCSKIMCSPPFTATPSGTYITPTGRVFDYTGVEKGVEYRLGVPQKLNNSTITFSAEGNRFIIKATAGRGVSTTVYTIEGNTCSVFISSSLKGISNRTTTNSCTVTEGNPN